MFIALAQMMHFAIITLFLLLMRNNQLQTATKTTKQLSELKKTHAATQRPVNKYRFCHWRLPMVRVFFCWAPASFSPSIWHFHNFATLIHRKHSGAAGKTRGTTPAPVLRTLPDSQRPPNHHCLFAQLAGSLGQVKTTPLLTMKHLLHESEQGSETLQAQPQFWKGSSVEQRPTENHSSERRCSCSSL